MTLLGDASQSQRKPPSSFTHVALTSLSQMFALRHSLISATHVVASHVFCWSRHVCCYSRVTFVIAFVLYEPINSLNNSVCLVAKYGLSEFMYVHMHVHVLVVALAASTQKCMFLNSSRHRVWYECCTFAVKGKSSDLHRSSRQR